MCAVLSAAIAVAGSSSVLAQRVGVDSYIDEPYHEYSYRETGNMQLSLVRPSDEERRGVVTPTRPGDCGVFGYWNGERCADAREPPPDMRYR
jgi:hypothetical protein